MTPAKATASTEGLILAPLDSGVWEAIEALRSAMLAERSSDRIPRIASFAAITRAGKLAAGPDPDAAVFALEYRLDPVL